MAQIFYPNSAAPFRISRSKIDLFLNCPRCFYLDRKLGISQPPGFPFSLNSAVDHLLKKEFDLHRSQNKTHPLMEHYSIQAKPYNNPKINDWRNTFVGIQYLHQPTNLFIFGAIDDVWINDSGKLHIVDYKATAKDSEVNLDADWQIGYKRQMEIYQWLFRHNNFDVSDIGYFVYCNGKKDRKAFDGKLEFDVVILSYRGNDNWMDKALADIKACLMQDKIPVASPNCQYCAYVKQAANVGQRA